MGSMRAMPFLTLLALVTKLSAQRVYEADNNVVFEDSNHHRISLGPAMSPVPVGNNKILLIRGARMGYGDRFACTKPELKNRIVLYDTKTRTESILYNRPITSEFLSEADGCIFEQADLSPDGSTLYIVTPWAATSGRLTIIDLRTEALRHVDGVNEVYVIRGGRAEGDLIYSRRIWGKAADDDVGYPYYPFIHAKPDGSQISIVSNESFTIGPTKKTPILDAYLKELSGRIYVQGRWVP
jgi:hypothetical protein